MRGRRRAAWRPVPTMTDGRWAASCDADPRRGRRRFWYGVIVAALLVIEGGLVAARTRAAPVIDGMRCRADGPVVVHIHQHLSLYERGRPVPISPGIGSGLTPLATPCLYDLHTHRADGLISIEAPRRRAYTLRQFFDIWRQPLNSRQVAALRANAGRWVRVYVDGRAYRGDPRAIRLADHTQITLEIGPPWISPPPFTFPEGT